MKALAEDDLSLVSGDAAVVNRRRRRVTLGRNAGVLTALIAVCVYLAISQPAFRTWGNFTNIVASNSAVLILGIGATFVIISGGLDLSIGAGATACGMVIGLSVTAGAPTIMVVLAPVGFGLLLGLINGLLITGARISFLVATLGTMSVYSSFALVVKSGATITVFGAHSFQPVYQFATGRVGPVPILMIFDVVVAVIAGIVLRHTAFGRSLFAVGANREAARLNGINVAGVVLAVYVITGLTVGLASIVQVGLLTGASPTVDPTQLLAVLAAVLIGGTAYSGGAGSIPGTIIGVLLLAVIQNGLTLSNVSSFWQGALNGTILIAAVGLGVLRDHGRLFRKARLTTR
jgi:ribose transport system permease protein